MKNLSKVWQKIIIWVTGYLNIIAFVLAGGYIFVKSEDEDVRSSAKTAFAITAVFTAINMLFTLVTYFMSLGNASGSAITNFSKVKIVVSILQIFVFVLFFILDMCGINFTASAKKEVTTTEE